MLTHLYARRVFLFQPSFFDHRHPSTDPCYTSSKLSKSALFLLLPLPFPLLFHTLGLYTAHASSDFCTVSSLFLQSYYIARKLIAKEATEWGKSGMISVIQQISSRTSGVLAADDASTAVMMSTVAYSIVIFHRECDSNAAPDEVTFTGEEDEGSWASGRRRSKWSHHLFVLPKPKEN